MAKRLMALDRQTTGSFIRLEDRRVRALKGLAKLDPALGERLSESKVRYNMLRLALRQGYSAYMVTGGDDEPRDVLVRETGLVDGLEREAVGVAGARGCVASLIG